jgi:hypothetical protein
MFNEINHKDCVYQFVALESCLILVRKNKMLEVWKSCAEDFLAFALDSIGQIRNSGNLLCFKSNEDSSLQMFDIAARTRIYANKECQFELEFKGDNIVNFVYDFKELRTFCGIFNVKENTQVWKSEKFLSLNFVGDALLGMGTDNTYLVDERTGNPIWTTVIGGSKKVVRYLSIMDENLWIVLKNKDDYSLLSLDVSHGQANSNHTIKYGYACHPIEEKNTLLCIHGFSRYEPETEYKEVNGLTGEVIRTGVVQSLLEQKLVLKDWEKFGEHIYFTAVREEKFPTHIGVLDYNTLELVRWQKVELEEGCYLPAGKAPVVSDNKLYILDTGGTLHIYQID